MIFFMISCLCPAARAPELSWRRKKRPDWERPRCRNAQSVVCDSGGYVAVRDTKRPSRQDGDHIVFAKRPVPSEHLSGFFGGNPGLQGIVFMTLRRDALLKEKKKMRGSIESYECDDTDKPSLRVSRRGFPGNF
jgi:hypothetical protein